MQRPLLDLAREVRASALRPVVGRQRLEQGGGFRLPFGGQHDVGELAFVELVLDGLELGAAEFQAVVFARVKFHIAIAFGVDVMARLQGAQRA